MIEMRGVNIGDVVQLGYKWTTLWGKDYWNQAFQNQVVGFVREINYKQIILQGSNPPEPYSLETKKKILSYKLGGVFSCEKLNHEDILMPSGTLPDENPPESPEQQSVKKIELKEVNLGDLIMLDQKWFYPHLNSQKFRNRSLGFVIGLNVNQISLVNYNPQNTPPPVRHTSTHPLSFVVAYHILKKEDFSAPTAEDSSSQDLPILQPGTVAR